MEARNQTGNKRHGCAGGCTRRDRARACRILQSHRMDDFYRFCDMDQTFTILSVVYSAGHPFTVLIQIGQTFAPLPWDYGLYRKSRPKKQRSISRVEKRGPRLTRFYDYIYAITDYALRFVQTREETNFYYTEIRCELSTSGQQHRGMHHAAS